MLRDYDTGETSTARVFVGKEIEHTPAYGKTTLFLATNQLTTEQILQLAREHGCEAVYYGANRMYRHNMDQTFQMQKLMDAGPRHRPGRRSLRQITNAGSCRFVMRVLSPDEGDQHVGVDGDHVPWPR